MERVGAVLDTTESVHATVDSASRLAYRAFANPVVKVLAVRAGAAIGHPPARRVGAQRRPAAQRLDPRDGPEPVAVARRAVWLVTGVVAGAASSLYAERKLRRTLEAARPGCNPTHSSPGRADGAPGRHVHRGRVRDAVVAARRRDAAAARTSSGPELAATHGHPGRARGADAAPTDRPDAADPRGRGRAPVTRRGGASGGRYATGPPSPWPTRIWGRDLRRGARRRPPARRLHPLLRRARPYRRAVGQPHPARPLGAVHHRRHGAVQAVLPRRRGAAVAPGHLGAEVLPHRGHRHRRHHPAALHVLRDARATSASATTSRPTPSPSPGSW